MFIPDLIQAHLSHFLNGFPIIQNFSGKYLFLLEVKHPPRPSAYFYYLFWHHTSESQSYIVFVSALGSILGENLPGST